MTRRAARLVILCCSLALPAAAEPVAVELVLREGANALAQWRPAVGGPALTVDGLRLVPSRAAAGDLGVWRLAVSNGSDHQRRLELTASAALHLVPAVATWWDGGTTEQRVSVGRQPDRRAGQEPNLFVPLTAVADADGATLLALTPDTLSSYGRPALEVATSGAATLTLADRLVLEPGQATTVSVCAGRVAGARYGLLGAAWESYQRAFPTYFTPTPGVCDNIWGASAEYQAWAGRPDTELMRRLHVTWDWCYSPFKRCGDSLVRDDEWVYQPLATPVEGHANSMLGRDYPLAKATPAQFRADRQAFFDQAGLDHGLMFYELAWWVEKQLGQAKFADSLVVDPQHKTELRSWCRYHDVELAVMPMGGSYEPRIVGDLERLAQELPLTGYALDVFVNQQRNYSPFVGRTPLPGRAWDDRGVYQDIGVSLSLLADRLHQVKLRDRPFERLALVGGNGAVGFHTDATLYELTFYGADRKRYPLWRMSMGQKPGVCWQGYDIPNILPNWPKMTRREFVQAFSGVADYVRLKCFQWGVFPTWSNLAGCDAFQADMPLLTELVRAGWHPLAPVSVTAPAKTWSWPARYGALGQYLVVSSPNEQPVPATLAVDHAPLDADWNGVYVDRRGSDVALEQTVAGRTTTIPVTLPRRGTLVLQQVLRLAGADATARATAHRELERVTITVELTTRQAGAVRLASVAPDGFTAGPLTVDAQPPGATLPAGRHVVKLTWQSTQFRLTRAQLEAFPFLVDGRPTFACVTATPQRRADQRVASRLSGYFEFYAHQGRQAAGVWTAPLGPTAPPNRPAVELQIGATGEAGWSLTNAGRLVLRAPDEATALRLTGALLDELDTKYVYRVPFRGGMAGMYQPVQVQHKLIGKTLTQALAEEGL